MSVLTSLLLKPDFHYDHPHHCDRPLPNLFPITGIIVMISGIAFNRPDHLSRLRAFPYDRFKIYAIVLICPDRTHFYPSDQGHLSRPCCLRSFG